MKKRNLIPRFLSLSLLLTACFLALRDGLNLTWWNLIHLGAVCLLVSAFVTVTYYNRITTIIGVFLGTAFEGSMILFAYERLFQEWMQYYNHVIPYVNAYYYTDYPYESTAPDGGYLLPLFLAVLFGLWMGKGVAVGKKLLLFGVPVPVSFASGFLLGYAPGMGAFLCLIGGLGFGLFIERQGETAAERKSRRLVFACLSGALLISGLLYLPVSGKAMAYHDRLKDWQLKQEDKMLARMEDSAFFGWLSRRLGGYEEYARLSNEPPKLSDKEMLRVTVEELPKTPVYIKNFTGVSYDNGVWYPSDGEEFAAWAEEQGMSADELGAFVLNQAYNETQSQMTIEILRSAGKACPMPYRGGLPKEAEILGDCGIRMPGTDSYRFLWDFSDEAYLEWYRRKSISRDKQVAEWLEEHERKLISGEMTVSDIRKEDYFQPERDWYFLYVDYAKEQYTKLPENQLLRLRENLGFAVEILDKNANGFFEYSFDLKPVPEGKDIVEYFIFDQRKGYCMHFASAYTLVLRMLGQPARYASGYLLLPEDFTENEDGTYTAVVRQERGHAWVEILSYPRGWMPLEVTPPAYYDSLTNRGAEESVAHIVEEINRPSASEPEEPKPEPEQAPEEPEKKPEEAPEPEKTEQELKQPQKEPENASGQGETPKAGYSFFQSLWTHLLAVLYPLLFLAALWALIVLRRRLLCSLRRKRLADPDSRKAAEALLKETFRWLSLLGIRFTGEEDEGTFADKTEEAVSYLKKGEFLEFIEIARVARYSKEPLTEGQMQYLMMIYKRIKHHETRRMKWYQKAYYRYVLGWM